MTFSTVAILVVQLKSSNSALRRYYCLGDDRETKQRAFSAKPGVSRCQHSAILDANGVAELRATRSARQPRTALCRMAY